MKTSREKLWTHFPGSAPGPLTIVVSTSTLEFGVRFPVSAVWKKQKCFFPIHSYKLSRPIVGSLHDREVACSASDLHSLNFESCVWRAESSPHASHHPKEVLLVQLFSLYVHKSYLNSFHFVNSIVITSDQRDLTIVVLHLHICAMLDRRRRR